MYDQSYLIHTLKKNPHLIHLLIQYLHSDGLLLLSISNKYLFYTLQIQRDFIEKCYWGPWLCTNMNQLGVLYEYIKTLKSFSIHVYNAITENSDRNLLSRKLVYISMNIGPYLTIIEDLDLSAFMSTLFLYKLRKQILSINSRLANLCLKIYGPDNHFWLTNHYQLNTKSPDCEHAENCRCNLFIVDYEISPLCSMELLLQKCNENLDEFFMYPTELSAFFLTQFLIHGGLLELAEKYLPTLKTPKLLDQIVQQAMGERVNPIFEKWLIDRLMWHDLLNDVYFDFGMYPWPKAENLRAENLLNTFDKLDNVSSILLSPNI